MSVDVVNVKSRTTYKFMKKIGANELKKATIRASPNNPDYRKKLLTFYQQEFHKEFHNKNARKNLTILDNSTIPHTLLLILYLKKIKTKFKKENSYKRKRQKKA